MDTVSLIVMKRCQGWDGSGSAGSTSCLVPLGSSAVLGFLRFRFCNHGARLMLAMALMSRASTRADERSFGYVTPCKGHDAYDACRGLQGRYP